LKLFWREKNYRQYFEPANHHRWLAHSRTEKMLGQLIGEASRGWFVLTLGYSVLVGGIINNCISALHWVGLIGQKLQNDVCSCVTTLTFR